MTPIERASDQLIDRLKAVGQLCLKDLEKTRAAVLGTNGTEPYDGADRELVDWFHEFEEDCFKTIALHHPVARDLRHMMSIYKSGQDFERVHSLIEKIGRKIKKISTLEGLNLPDELADQYETVQTMLRSGLDLAFSEQTGGDIPAALRQLEESSNKAKKALKSNIEAQIQDDGSRSRDLLLIIGISRHLDRMAKIVMSILED